MSSPSVLYTINLLSTAINMSVQSIKKIHPVFVLFSNVKNTNKTPAILFSFEDRKKHFQKMVDILDKLIDNQRYSSEKMTL